MSYGLIVLTLTLTTQSTRSSHNNVVYSGIKSGWIYLLCKTRFNLDKGQNSSFKQCLVVHRFAEEREFHNLGPIYEAVLLNFSVLGFRSTKLFFNPALVVTPDTRLRFLNVGLFLLPYMKCRRCYSLRYRSFNNFDSK